MFTGRTALICILSFFTVIFSVNGVLVYNALNSWSGLSAKDAYRKGRYYNEIIDAGLEQKRRGWHVALTTRTNNSLDIFLQVEARNADGAAINSLELTALLKRPVRPDIDQRIVFKSLGKGKYSGVGKLPKSGQWAVELSAKQNGRQVYRLDSRIVVK